MRHTQKTTAIAVMTLLSTTAFSIHAHAEEKKTDDRRVKVMEQVTVIGTQDRLEEIPGSATLVGKETLERYQYTDVNRALREVPGVVAQEEDGYGLRPNIGIRGGRSDRSADITLMEDKVLAAPAPYAAPAAYYFPQMDRMESLEIIKGTGAIKYGPRTTNGVLNMVTKPIPAKKQADFLAEAGSYESYRTMLTTGASFENVGLMLNAVHKETDGFKKIDFVGGDSGYDAQDVIGKFRIHTDASAERYQELEIKTGYYDELSNETYLGLTDSDFSINPNRRYGSSQLDEMDVNAWQAAATHFIEISRDTNLTTTLYHNEVKRSWYKLDSVRVGGVSRSLSAIFNDPTANAAWLSALQSANTAGGTFVIRDNNRSYQAQGIQSAVATNYLLGETRNKLEIGMRYHTDEEDRFQRDDRFALVNGIAVFNSFGTPGAAGNRIVSADATSVFIENEMAWGKWAVTPGVRFEHINLKSQNFGSADPARSGSALVVLENTLNVVIPGIGVAYDVNDSWKLLAGVHKGFAPPGVPNNASEAAFSREEESINYEIGTRYANGPWTGEMFVFLNNYKNLLGRDTLSSGGSGSGDAFNGGEVQVHGLEASLGYDAAKIIGLGNGYRLPLRATYSHINGEFDNSFVSTFEEWGTVTAGDKLPYLPRHQLHLSAGVETGDWGVSLGGKYVDDMRSVAGSGPIPASRLIEAHWVVDMAGEYKITDNISAFATVENALDETYVAARRPAGARPGMPLTAMAGVKISLW